MSLHQKSIEQIQAEIQSKRISGREVVEYFIKRYDTYASELNCTNIFDKDYINRQLAEVERRESSGENLPLKYIPILVKDNIVTDQLPTTCSSKFLEGFQSFYNATGVEKLIDAGAIVFGKANCDEFAMGSSNENSAYGNVKNPWDYSRVPGGSSGGSASATAAMLSPISLGSETGGSVRQPASFCGVVGVKPTYGRVSRYGLVAFGSSLDQIGPFSRYVKDAALGLDVMSGADPRDYTSSRSTKLNSFEFIGKNSQDSSKPLAGKKIARVKEFFTKDFSASVLDCVNRASDKLVELGAEVEEISLQHINYSVAVYYVLAPAEASSNLSRFDGVRYGQRSKESQTLEELYLNSRSEGFGDEVKRRIILGTFVLSSGYYDAFYGKASKLRDFITEDFRRAFQKYDFLISPVSPTTAFKFGEKAKDPLAMYLSDISTIGANLAGLPAMSIPCGYSSENSMPVGMQIMAPWWKESEMLLLAHHYEQTTLWVEKEMPHVK